ncbi:hypothetical protein Athai_25140 [Actinocatenispora thailandica]|uniref:PPE family domain-containing protein n=1 Tax=Actinocatenispora thailandica TaxID=227318 RepID=A0A7R7DNZ2_9ACTN|nr:hypothetical protein [Actinocatenispora thailandica]BCJ35011.1 hypothetical protein Athai_25140 [Actinocatenispora thailandica]
MGMTANDGSGDSGGGATWERPVRQISLAARNDVLADMAKHWKSYVDGIGEHVKPVGDVWDDHLSDWHGPAAKACQAQLQKIAHNLNAIAVNYQEMPRLLQNCSTSVRDAVGAIPIPLFGGGGAELPAGNSQTDGQGLYDDYDQDRSAYADYAFQRRAYDQMIAGARVRGAGAKSYHNTAVESDTVTRDYHADPNGKYLEEVAHWYTSHQQTAVHAEEHLHNVYATAHENVPERAKIKYDPSGDSSADSHTTPPPPPPPPPGGGGGLDTAGPALGALPPPVGGKLPSMQSAMLHSLPPHELLGQPTARDPSTAEDPQGTSLAGAVPGADVGAGRGVGPAGGIGAGSLPGVGSAGSGSVGGMPATASGAGWWTGPPVGAPVGPRVASPRLGAAGAHGAGAARVGGVGMMPHSGAGTGRKEPEERQTWLTEDDKDVWGPRWEDQFSGLVE